MPQTGRAHSGPVMSTMVQKTTPTSAVTSARMSVPCSEKYLRMRKYAAVMTMPVVATDEGSMPDGRVTTKGTLHATIPMATAAHLAKRSADSLGRTRYCTEAMKLMKKSRNAVQAEG